MGKLQRMLSYRRYLASFIRGTGIPLACASSASTPLAPAETYLPSYENEASGYFSTCLFAGSPGWEETYLRPLIISAQSWLAEFPGWRYRVYVPVDFPGENILEMVAAGLEIVRMNREKEDNAPTLWRFLPAAQELPFLSMDADESYSEEVARHFRLWLAGDRKFFWRRFLGGLLWPVAALAWGVRGGLPDWEEKVARFADTCNCFGCDELFLKNELYPLLASDQTYLVKSQFFEFFWAFVIFLLLVSFGYLLWLTHLAGKPGKSERLFSRTIAQN